MSTSAPRQAILATLLTLLALASASESLALAQTSSQTGSPTAIPAVAHIPELDLNSVALKSGDRYTNCGVVQKVREAACHFDEVVFDQPTGSDALISQAARRIDMSAFGPGVSLGNIGGWRVNKVDVEFLNSAVRGITQAHSLFLNKHAVGDTMGTYNYIFSDGGSTALSDESIKGEAIDMGETTGYFHGAIASTTGSGDIAPVLKFVSGNGWTTDGAPLLDITKGTVSGLITGPSQPLPHSGYLYTFPVDNDLSLTTAWGVCNDIIPSNKLVQVNTPVTCNVSLQFGRFEAGGVVCVAGPNYPEQAPITAAGAVIGGSQSITISLRNPNGKGASIFQGGLCGQYISFDANFAVSGYRSSYYAFRSAGRTPLDLRDERQRRH